MLTWLKVNGRVFNQGSQLFNCWFPELCSRGTGNTVTDYGLQWARIMTGPSKADSASVSSAGFRQCDPEAHGDPPKKHPTSPVLTKNPLGLAYVIRRLRVSRPFRCFMVQLRVPHLWGQRSSNFEGLRNYTVANCCRPIKCLPSHTAGVVILRPYQMLLQLTEFLDSGSLWSLHAFSTRRC